MGGMYEILKVVDQFLQEEGLETFSKSEIFEKTAVCQASLTNNLTRLVKAGILERIEYHDGKYPRVRYKLKNEFIDFVRNSLYR